MIGIYVVASALLVIWVYRSFLRDSGPSLAHLPSPKGLPIVGNALQVNAQRPEFTFTEWGKEFKDVFAVKLFNTSAVVMNSFDAIYEALVVKGDAFAGRPWVHKKTFRIQLLSENFQNIMMQNPNPRWKKMRTVSHRHIKLYDASMKSRIEEVNIDILQDLVQEFRDRQGKTFNPRDTVRNAIVNVMTSLLVDKKYKVTDEEYLLYKQIETVVPMMVLTTGKGVELDIFPWLRHFGNETYKHWERLHEAKTKLWSLFKAEARATMKDTEEEKKHEGVVHAFLRLLDDVPTKPDDGYALEEHQVKMTCLDLLVAGTTTSSSSFYCYLNIISQHPEVQRRLQEEADAVLGSDRPVTLQDRNNMPYTQATVLELLRFSSVGPLIVPHATLCDATVCGYKIPAGVMILCNLWALHHDETFWDKPFEFQPTRFLEEDGQLVSASHENRRHLMPFSAGPRVCVGEVLAIGRLFLLIATFAQVFDIKHGPVKVSFDPREYKPALALVSGDFEIQAVSRNETLFKA